MKPSDLIPAAKSENGTEVALYGAFIDKLESPPEIIVKSLTGPSGQTLCRLLHAILGMSGESGELVDAIKKAIVYGKTLDMTNLKEELGDIRWYYQLALNAAGWTDEEIVAANMGKLTVRYPDKWDAARCENRDRASEMKALEAPKSNS